jgi:CelD/BcsL family acetyltransferase involved in cellulose biosynthesis
VFRSHGLYLNRSGDPRFDCVFIEYNGLLAARACADGMLGLAVEWFRTEQRQSDEFYLSGITTPARLTPDLMQELTAMPSFAVDLTGLANTGGDVAALLSGNARQQLRRAQRSFAAFGPLTLSEASSADEALSYFAGLKQLHIPSWERRNKAHSFTNPYFERFHCHLIEQHFACGCVQMLRIAAGDELLGYLYNFRHDGKIYAYQSGFADADRQRRPGAVGHYLAINHNHRLGARSYDFMAGRNQLKETFATDRTELFWQVVQRRALKFRLERGARAVKRAFTG